MLVNTADTIGQLIQGANQVTGSTFITLFILTAIVLLACFGLGFPVEFSIIAVLPLHIGILAYTSDWFSVAGVFLIYIGILIAKNWPTN